MAAPPRRGTRAARARGRLPWGAPHIAVAALVALPRLAGAARNGGLAARVAAPAPAPEEPALLGGELPVSDVGTQYWKAQSTADALEVLEAANAAEEARQRNMGPLQLFQEMLVGVGGGTGATVGGTGDPAIDQDLLRRMRYQDEAVMLLLLLAYVGSLAFSASIAYQQACNGSPVTYYADPRYHQIAVEGHDLPGFLEAFGQPPKVQLEVTGLIPMPPLPDFLTEASVEWLGSRYAVAFSFALDLAPWVRREQEDECGAARAAAGSQAAAAAAGLGGLAAGMTLVDLPILEAFLEHNRNDLATVEFQKEVAWPDWEELATNIKSHIRQQGFDGTIMVRKSESECMTIYKNQPWANFMHSRSIKVLCALSIVGWVFYQPYMWLRQRALQVCVRYRVDVKIGDYWPLISDKITADGFVVRT